MRDASGWDLRLDAQTMEQYTRSGEWPGLTVWQAALRWAERGSDQLIVTDDAGAHTVGEAIRTARELAAGLNVLGLKPGDVISYQLPNWWETMVIDLAACLSGLVCNPIVPIYREAEVGFILHDAHAKVFFVPSSFRGFGHAAMADRLRTRLPELAHVVVLRKAADSGQLNLESVLALGREHQWSAPEVSANAVKLVLYTSGTTGSPKGVLHTHNSFMSEINAVINFWRVGASDVVIMPSPVSHVTGYLYGVELPWVAACPVVYMERWDAALAAALIQKHAATLTVGATPFLAELAQRADEYQGLPSLRLFASGGAPVAPEIVHRARRALPNCTVFRVYGCTEAPTITLGIAAHEDPDLGASTDGRIVNNTVRICDPDGIDVPVGCEGEVLVRGPEVMLGYTRWEDTIEAFDGEGYFRTGDLAYMSSQGFLTISGRKKDLIIRGGENISAKEIEDVLHALPGIAEAAVVAMPHARLGEGVCAYVVPAPQASVDAASVAAAMAGSGLARQKWPDRVEVVGELPRTASGKVQKNILRDRIRNLLASEHREPVEGSQ